MNLVDQHKFTASKNILRELQEGTPTSWQSARSRDFRREPGGPGERMKLNVLQRSATNAIW